MASGACQPRAPAPEAMRLHFDDLSPRGRPALTLGPLGHDLHLEPGRVDHFEMAPANEAAFAVYTGEHPPSFCTADQRQQPILGSYLRFDQAAAFEPRFPWVEGMTYTACASPRGDSLHLVFRIPVPQARAAPTVTGVWPATDEVPENLLRFYVHFSKPMQQRDVASFVSLLDVNGEPLLEPFVEIPNGLWDEASTRLTLILHPGRIKRGVGPNERLGEVLREGTTVRLRVDAALRSLDGAALGSPHEEAFRVVAADRSSPRTERWIVRAPTHSEEPVDVVFDDWMDAAQLQRFAWVETAAGEPVPGAVAVLQGGHKWGFSPTAGWQPGEYRIVARRDIEDLAGNTADRQFDAEIHESEGHRFETAMPPPHLELSFRFEPDGGGI